MTACERVEGWLAGFVAGELPAGAREKLERHLTRCPACTEALFHYREVIRLAGALPPHEPPPAAAGRILAALHAAQLRPASGALDETRLDIPLAPTPGRPGG